ncbi:DUF5060 domain-containing protein [Pontiellaceae bacterium B1224]|nr:DUF5060 domain-containing protein [Pontiellaceae bacterium B1224]
MFSQVKAGAGLFVVFFLCHISGGDVPLYRVFETSISNTNSYTNKFTEVELEAVFTAPSGSNILWRGFFDGDGSGGGDFNSGSIWKLRFMPDEIGSWNYTFSWTDGTSGGSGSFLCVSNGAGKGVIQAYQDNPHWFAYNGTEPVFLKSYHLYYEGLFHHDISWTATNVYQQFIDEGYNHLQIYLFPSSWYDDGAWKFADVPETDPKALLFSTTTPSISMNFQVCRGVDEHVAWLNNHDIGMLGHQGFDGRTDGPRFHRMSSAEQEFYVKYMCARYAPFAMLTWNYTWETRGDGPELVWADLLEQYDPWLHLRSYHDRYPDFGPGTEDGNNFNDSRYSFANIENHVQDASTPGNHEPWTHHLTTVASYEEKPVYMSEGNGLWRWFWGAKEEQIHRNAWAVTTGGGSFCWLGHSEGAGSSSIFEWGDAKNRIDYLCYIMTEDLEFYSMTPQDGLLSDIVSGDTCYCLAEVGKQYLVYKEDGGSFNLNLAPGEYDSIWIDARTNARLLNGTVTSLGGNMAFIVPDNTTEWVLVLRGHIPPSDYDIWISEFFLGETNEAVIGKPSDPDHDGVPNLVEYAYCLVPNQSDNEKLFSFQAQGQKGYINLNLRGGDHFINPYIEIREDLLSDDWLPPAILIHSNNVWRVDNVDWNIEEQNEVEPSKWSLRVKLPSNLINTSVFIRYGIRDVSQ